MLRVGPTKDVNLITRPVIPLYNIVPHQTAPGEFERTAGFGDIILLELLSPADSGKWILGAAAPNQAEYDFTVDYRPPWPRPAFLQGLWLRVRAAIVDQQGANQLDWQVRVILNWERDLL